jgi:hypothetical protein
MKNYIEVHEVVFKPTDLDLYRKLCADDDFESILYDQGVFKRDVYEIKPGIFKGMFQIDPNMAGQSFRWFKDQGVEFVFLGPCKVTKMVAQEALREIESMGA